METDSFIIHVDKCTSKCTSYNLDHFALPIKELYSHIMKSTGGHRLKVQGKGTIRWKIQDTNGSFAIGTKCN
eukprot:15335066-Ditylum_brightwellii.AAC.1